MFALKLRPRPRQALRRCFVTLGVLMFSLSGGAASAEAILVFAAASLKVPLDRVAAEWSIATGTEVKISYAGSSALARQIEHGAPADLYLSANLAWMDHLADQGAINAASRVDLFSNRLAMIAPAGAGQTLDLRQRTDVLALLGDSVLAMAHPDAVPAGIYGKAALESLGLWTPLQARIARTQDVRAALALVARGEAALGIVYMSDAISLPAVRIVATFPKDSHPPIRYPAALVGDSPAAQAAAFLRNLQTPRAMAIFYEAGFQRLDAAL